MAKKGLKPVQTKNEARERGRKGGIASGVARREKKTIRETLEALLALPCDADKGQTNLYAMTAALLRKALTGDVAAFSTVRDTVGEKPTDKHQVEGGDKPVGVEHTISPALQSALDAIRGLRDDQD